MRKQILWTMFALLWLLPVCGLAVTEGVVEAAPGVAVELETGSGLFGAWEEGLADIERSARRVLEERLGCPTDMTLYMIDVGDTMYSGTRTGVWQDEAMRAYIYINFRFTDERMGGSMSAQVGFDFETGRLGSCRLSRWYEGEDAQETLERELPRTTMQTDRKLHRALLDDYLQNALGLSGYAMLDDGQAEFPDGSVIHATIGEQSGQVIAVEISRFGEEDAVQ